MAELENDMAPSEAEMDHWKTNMAILDKKETQYLQEYSNYKVKQHILSSSFPS